MEKGQGDPQKCFLGREIEDFLDIVRIRDEINDAQLHVGVIPIANPPFALKGDGPLPPEYTLDVVSQSDLPLDQQTGGGWGAWVVGACSSWISTDSQNVSEEYRKFSEDALQKEIEWACHCGMYGCILPTPDYLHCARYAAVIAPFLNGQSYQFSVRIPLTLSSEYFNGGASRKVPVFYRTPPPQGTNRTVAKNVKTEEVSSDVPTPAPTTPAPPVSGEELEDMYGEGVPFDDDEQEGPCEFDAAEAHRREVSQTRTDDDRLDGWRVWMNLKRLVDSRFLTVTLELTPNLPEDPIYFERWMAEPVKALVITKECFINNSKGMPILSKAHSKIVQMMMKKGAQIILKINRQPSTVRADEDLVQFLRYKNYIWQIFHNKLPFLSESEKFEFSYRDVLQHPLQPLQDNLESTTYEIFERDPVKYAEYQRAIEACLRDKIAQKPGEKLVLMVVGAGRGPLMTAALNAVTAVGIADREFRFIVVEKNQNAVITLRWKVQNETHPLWRKVEVVGGDMRFWEPEGNTKADIMISELLGSFGDNELSPECLDGAQRFLKDDGVSIPREYTSFIRPASCHKIWNEIRVMGEKFLQTSYVVNMQSAYFPSVQKPQRVFTFAHPNWKINPRSNQHNCRDTWIDFDMTTDTLLHGMAGYFSTVLYGDIVLSILPETFSTGMFSWFPLFFPFKTPVFLKKGERIRFHISRKDDEHKVWYEWSLTGPQSTPIHNSQGRSHAIGK